MSDSAIIVRLNGILALLLAAVSLLGGLVFGRGYADELFFSVMSFVVLVTLSIGVVLVRSADLGAPPRT
ncbi:hypothetical protein [Haloarcula brevis]|uniref:hypothetical protein n=1 Tax=Haloarcula brevis TaxID=3111453 RepID=UPI00300F3171